MSRSQPLGSSVLRVARQIFPEDLQAQEAFVASLLESGAAPAAVVVRTGVDLGELELVEPPAWLPKQCVALSEGSRVGSSVAHQAGDLYAFDLSSAFVLAGLSEVRPPCEAIFDMCSAPGGKAIGAWAILQPQQLICNEVIGKRHGALWSNLKRCRIAPVSVLQLDPGLCAEQHPESADLVIVDAPCSGQSLIRKDHLQAGAFHKHTVHTNSKRQRRILINSWKIVKPGGFLLYSTCTFSPEENEKVLEWLCKQDDRCQVREVPIVADYRSKLSELPCYRLLPQHNQGAGAFFALLRKAP